MSDDGVSSLSAWMEFARPVLQVLSDGAVWTFADLRAAVAAAMSEGTGDPDISAGPRAEKFVRAVRDLVAVGAVTQESSSRTSITQFGRQLLAADPVETTLINQLPAYREATSMQHIASREPVEDRREAYWFVDAHHAGVESKDQTQRFLDGGIWENSVADKYLDQVGSMQPGDLIAIKHAYIRRADLPFDGRGRDVPVMAIKATGTVVANLRDGRMVEVDWDPAEPLREWYFYTSEQTVWRVERGDWMRDGLIDFTFDWAEQDLDRFRNAPDWADRFGDDAVAVVEPGDESEIDEEALQGRTDAYTLTDIVADGCFVPEPVLGDYLDALRTKKNLILQGPPGTGKTWLAKRLGYALIGSKDRNLLRAIQFHPTLAYEDFVRGWRPSGDGKLQLEDGMFLDIVNAARADPGNNHVLVIEEINRGNLAQIFGELLTLLENSKRTPGEALELSYRRPGEPPTYLPENLYIIGTMNLADRSLAIVDFALRRRFAFRNLEPTLNESWRRWVSEHNDIPDDFLTVLAHRVNALNDTIAADRSLGEQYRIGHSFFTPYGAARVEDPATWLRRVVDSEIRPLLDEYWFDDPERVQKEAEALLGYPL
ncbi:AAA family ATPase [Rhodococcus spongiicola]|uniref:AAA family ATPase n=1 Tax=Rhodococcus spongiicola TaxID=2487352 RepID=A0A438AU43_9NOCA|nr:AAA family ATPase [Rhodococcus spongiicola]RVW02281.1 AAA family ATPase [Rhodococcus spongiicola]